MLSVLGPRQLANLNTHMRSLNFFADCGFSDPASLGQAGENTSLTSSGTYFSHKLWDIVCCWHVDPMIMSECLRNGDRKKEQEVSFKTAF